MNTWDHYGKEDPYYGVLSSEEFRSARMDAQARERFFESGAKQVDLFITQAEAVCGHKMSGTALDYGCGVGRLSKALSTRFDKVIGVDLSRDMLAEAQRNLAGQGNVTFEHVEAMSDGPVDFIISKIVFQHIPPEHGLKILARLASRLSDRGAGVIDFPVAYTGGALRYAMRSLKRAWPFGPPVIPMYMYELAQVEAALRGAGVRRIEVQRVAAPPFDKAVVAFAK